MGVGVLSADIEHPIGWRSMHGDLRTEPRAEVSRRRSRRVYSVHIYDLRVMVLAVFLGEQTVGLRNRLDSRPSSAMYT